MVSREAKVLAIISEARRTPAGERLTFVLSRCGSDHELAQEILTLLQVHSTGESYLTISSLSAPGAFLPGQKILGGRYELSAELGRGGMGVVYEAWQSSPRRKVAIKVLTAEVVNEEAAIDRLRREASLLAILDHPQIVGVIECAEYAGMFFIVMDYVAGPGGQAATTLKDLLAQGPLELSTIVGILRDTAAALAFAHARGVVHRDIKPSNILIDRDGRPRIIDFGIASCESFADDGVMFGAGPAGTRAYMAPEQGESIAVADHRADIYALGVLLYEMLTGVIPSEGSPSPSQVRPGISHLWDELYWGAVRDDRNQRIASVTKFQQLLTCDELLPRSAAPKPAAGLGLRSMFAALDWLPPTAGPRAQVALALQPSAPDMTELLKAWLGFTIWTRVSVSLGAFVLLSLFALEFIRNGYFWVGAVGLVGTSWSVTEILECCGITCGHRPGELRLMRNVIGTMLVGIWVALQHALANGITWWSVPLIPLLPLALLLVIFYINPDFRKAL